MPSTTAVIRPARAADLPRLLELYQELSELSEIPEGTVREASAAHAAALVQIDADQRSRVVVIEDHGRVLGALSLYVLPSLSHGARPSAIVENVVVDRAAQRGGYGRLLMDYAQAQARAAGCYKVSLTSNRKRTPAHAFYEGLGYQASHVGFTMYADHDG